MLSPDEVKAEIDRLTQIRDQCLPGSLRSYLDERIEDLKWIITERPAKKWDARKAPCPTCGFHITTRNAMPFVIEDDAADELDRPKEMGE